jgi:PhoH-like ATPase
VDTLKSMSNRKLLLIDTSVLLYDKESIHSFPGNDVILPLIVLDEIDRFKDKPGLLGENARYVNRFLDELRKKGRLDQGVELDDDTNQTIAVTVGAPILKIPGLDLSSGDNMIVATALEYKELHPTRTIKVVTKDINLRVKCDALGISAEDYYKDYIDVDLEGYTGIRDIDLDDEFIDELYAVGYCDVDESYALYPNTFVICKGTASKSALCTFRDGHLHRLQNSHIESETDIKPRNKEQRFALHALKSNDVPLVSLTGLAGSGKTFLALMAAIDGLYTKQYERIVVTRSIQPVGRELGYLPGDVGEKMAPWMAPLLDNFKHHFKDKTYFEMMLEKGEIEIAPLSFIRGRTFNNSYVIVDEAQNATIHELKTIITRLGENSKIVLMGDTDQIDTPYIDKRSNGLAIVIEKFKSSEFSAHVHLKRGERSAIATYASQVL